ncbi:MAG: dephospho-CoA kinase [Fuerstiella sp.]
MTSAPVIGILGGIGSGKSSVVREIQDLNLAIIDADVVGHEVLKSQDVIARLTKALGTGILKNGAIDRRSLGEMVFGENSGSQSNLQKLNAIVHPEIRKRLHKEIESAKNTADAVILDASLLLEGNWDQHCDHLIFVDTNAQIRQARVQENRGWDAEELPKREKTQVPIAVKRQRADFTVDNSGVLEQSSRQMRNILERILTQSLSQN